MTPGTPLAQGLLDLLRAPSPCLLATIDPDGSPQLTQTWVDTDGEHVLVNTVEGYRKLRNVERDPRVSVSVSVLDPADTATYWSVAGTVVGISTEGAREHIEELSQKNTGGPYADYSGGKQRVLLTIRVDRVVHAPWH